MPYFSFFITWSVLNRNDLIWRQKYQTSQNLVSSASSSSGKRLMILFSEFSIVWFIVILRSCMWVAQRKRIIWMNRISAGQKKGERNNYWRKNKDRLSCAHTKRERKKHGRLYTRKRGERASSVSVYVIIAAMFW
jgi:hypothetical protein